MIILTELRKYRKIYIQPHSFPDADAVAASYGLYELLHSLNIESEIVCTTPRTASTKPNLDKMLRKIEDKITFSVDSIVEQDDNYALFLVDVQKGNSNVKCLNSKHIYCIDHHEEYDTSDYVDYDIRSSIGASSTIICNYYKQYNKVPTKLGATLLSFGIYQDTGSLSEKTTNLDTDYKMWLNNLYDKSYYDELIHSSFSFNDMVTLSNALSSAEQYRNVVFCKVDSNDDNMLGNISDTLAEISDIDIVVTYAERPIGWKLSIRSYNMILNAVDVIESLTSQFSILGGGHVNKGGGIILSKDFNIDYSNVTFNIWLKSEVIKLVNKWSNALILDNKTEAPNYIIDKSILVEKIANPIRYIKVLDTEESTVKISTLTGTVYINPKTHYILIGIIGDIYPIGINTFNNLYEVSEENIECYSDEILINTYKKEGYGIRIGSTKYKLDDILNLPVALPNQSRRRSYKLETPCIIKRGNDLLKGDEGDYVILNDNGFPTHISKKDIYVKTFIEIA